MTGLRVMKRVYAHRLGRALMLRRPMLVVFDSGDNHHDIGLRRLGHLEVRAASILAMPILAVWCKIPLLA